MLPSEDIMRSTSARAGISSEKMATGSLAPMATASAMFIAKVVLPIEGRPAMMMRSPACKPAVILSRSLNPVGMPMTSVPRRPISWM